MAQMSLGETVDETISTLRARAEVDEEARGHLEEMMAIIWPECFYDPYSEATKRFADRLWPHIDALNKKWNLRAVKEPTPK